MSSDAKLILDTLKSMQSTDQFLLNAIERLLDRIEKLEKEVKFDYENPN
jgi:hypothetical protein